MAKFLSNSFSSKGVRKVQLRSSKSLPRVQGLKELRTHIPNASFQPSRELAPIEQSLKFSDEKQKQLHILKGISFGGAGIFFWWELGCVLWLLENVDVDTCPLYGASGGALAATLTACRVDVFRAFDAADRLAAETGLFERPLGLAGIWGNLIRQWLDELLPDNAAEICKDHVSIIVTQLPRMKLIRISDYASRDALIEANMASCHIPFFLDGKLSNSFNGMNCVDGSLHDFLSGSNSNILTCNGTTLLFDYFDDEKLNYKRFDFVSLKKPAEVLNMIHLGYRYAERLSKTEKFEKALLKLEKENFFLLKNSSIHFKS